MVALLVFHSCHIINLRSAECHTCLNLGYTTCPEPVWTLELSSFQARCEDRYFA